MAKSKGKKEPAATSSSEGPTHSVLWAAWQRFEAGDMVEARRLAQAAAEGQLGPDDDKVAADLAKRMSSPEVTLSPVPQDVGKMLVDRTKTLPKAYVFAAVTLSIFAILVTLALTRYAHH